MELMAYEHQTAGTVTALNNELEKIELDLRTKLSRKPDDERVMEADLDMNSNRILNLPAPGSDTEPVRRMDLIGGFTVVDDGNFVLYRSTIPPTPTNGHAWFDKDQAFYIGDNNQWNLVSGGGSNGIVYQSSLPISKEEGVTYFDADRMEHVYTYNDGDNLNYLAVPLLAGTGGGVSGGGGGGGNTSTLAPASVLGESLVASTSIPEAHKIKTIVPGTGLKAVATGTELTLNVDLTDSTAATGEGLVITTDGTSSAKKQIKKLKQGLGVSFTADAESLTISATGGGGTGSGIVYSNTLPGTKVEQSTYFDHEKLELITTYNDGDSLQYLAHPMTGGGQQASGGGGSTTTLSNAGTAPDGAALVGSLSGVNYPIRRVKAGSSLTTIVTENTNNITIDALDVVAPAVSGTSLVGTKTSTTQPIKRLVAGSNITLSDSGSAVTISSSGGGGGGPALTDSLTRINALAPVNNNVMVWTSSGVDQFPTTVSTRAMMGLSTVANTIPYFTGTTTASLTSLTPFMLTMLGMTGVPTALAHLKITSGTNANGGWLRIGTGDTSGVQICWHTIVCNGTNTASGAGFVGPNATWTYPQAFAAIPAVSGTQQDGAAAWIMNGSTGNSTTAASFRQSSFLTGTANVAVGVLAIGYY
jgi:hypothetical protein